MKGTDEREFILMNASYIAFIFLMSLLSVFNAILLMVFRLPELDNLILIINFGISLILLADFLYSMIKTRASRAYLFSWYGWMAGIGSLPIPGIALFRVIQSILFVRKLRGAALSEASKRALRQRSRNTFLTTLFLALLALELAGIFILRAESTVQGAEITTAQDALWWGYVTMSTVGYGDLVPVTTNGRVIGLITVTVGVVLFSVTTSFMTDWFRRERSDAEDSSIEESYTAPDDPRRQLLEIRRLMDEQEQVHQANLSEIQARLDDLERLIS